MEMTHSQYDTIMDMPVDRFYKYIQWKIKYDEEVIRMQKENMK